MMCYQKAVSPTAFFVFATVMPRFFWHLDPSDHHLLPP
ncbi:hypothetical protein L579_0061 [Pantoea sp. AS-PWVM4]|nr:hypothetical protein L579_0061 [Pantoea sp. AS-PWVM4]